MVNLLKNITIYQVGIKLDVVIHAATALDGGVRIRSLSEAFKASHNITALKVLSITVSRLLSHSHPDKFTCPFGFQGRHIVSRNKLDDEVAVGWDVRLL